MRVLSCGSCGAPLDAPWSELVVICHYCGGNNLPGQAGDPVPASVPVDGRPRVNLGGRSYVIEQQLAVGDSSHVYRARWVMRLGELVVLKVLSVRSDADRFAHEWRTLLALAASQADGAQHFVTRLPTPIAHGIVESDEPRPASVFGWKGGFVHTLEQVRHVHPSGVRGPVVVWVLKRLLELLGFVHRSGFVHGAVTPDHVLIHPYDHGATLVGWTCAESWRPGVRSRLTTQSARWEALYQGSREATTTLDIQMACRVATMLGGWSHAATADAPRLAMLLDRGSAGVFDDAWAMRDALVEVSDAVFGPPAYNPLPMPGWAR